MAACARVGPSEPKTFEPHAAALCLVQARNNTSKRFSPVRSTLRELALLCFASRSTVISTCLTCNAGIHRQFETQEHPLESVYLFRKAMGDGFGREIF